MAFLDKINKEALLSKAKTAAQKASEMAAKAAELAKNSVSQVQTAYETNKQTRELAKQPQEGGLARYEVSYKGGHPDYPVQKGNKWHPQILMDVMPDRFSFLPKEASSSWFFGIEIPFHAVSDIQIVERTVNTAESILVTAADNLDFKTKNMLEISYRDADGDELVLRCEMLTGLTYMGQARVCLELMDLLRSKKLIRQFAGKQELPAPAPVQMQADVYDQLKKCKDLLDCGALTQEEFDAQKKQLLEM